MPASSGRCLRIDTLPLAIDVTRHIEHAIRECGEGHVGIGTEGTIPPVERMPRFDTTTAGPSAA